MFSPRGENYFYFKKVFFVKKREDADALTRIVSSDFSRTYALSIGRAGASGQKIKGLKTACFID